MSETVTLGSHKNNKENTRKRERSEVDKEQGTSESTTSAPKGKKVKKNPLNPLAKKYGHHKRHNQGTSHPDTSKHQPTGGTSLAAVRKRIRDTTRSLQRPGLPATLQRDLQRRLEALQSEIVEVQTQQQEKKMHAKYKYVRFVEEKKVAKRIKQLSKQLESPPSDVNEQARLQSSLSNWQLKQAYIQKFPFDMKYIALFPVGAGEEKEAEEESSAEGNKEAEQKNVDPIQSAVFGRIKKAMASGTLSSLKLRKSDIISSSDIRVNDALLNHEDPTSNPVKTSAKTGTTTLEDDFFL